MPSAILIIDDDASFRTVVRIRLKSFLNDLVFTESSSLTDARTLLKEKKARDFDLVILDQHLPDGRGIELLNEGYFQQLAVLAVSSDADPAMPGATIKAGAQFFLAKTQVSEPLFQPLVLGLIDRNRIQRELEEVRMNQVMIDTVKRLVATLRHEINNPLGAVLGAAYLMQHGTTLNAEQAEAARVVDESGRRIKHVLDELTHAMSLESVQKAHEAVFHIPGDAPWEAMGEEPPNQPEKKTK
jgi:response regulator of citrate/malate metabolism